MLSFPDGSMILYAIFPVRILLKSLFSLSEALKIIYPVINQGFTVIWLRISRVFIVGSYLF